MSQGDRFIKKQQRFDAQDKEPEVSLAHSVSFESKVEFIEAESLTDAEIESNINQQLSGFESIDLAQDKPVKTRRSMLGKLCLFSIVLVVIVEAILGLQAAFIQSSWLFALYAGVTALVVLWTGKITLGEWRHLKALKQVEDTQAVGQRLSQSMQMGEADKFIDSIMAKLPTTAETSKFSMSLTPEQNDAEKLMLFDEIVLTERDLAAKKIVRRFAQESALLLAASPLAVLDMAIILWRNQSMINQLAECYGVELGYWSRIKLIRSIITNIIYAGSSEIVTDLGTQLLSVEMSGKLSARLGQGLGGGLLTARLGYQAMALCRPLAFSLDSKPKLSSIHKELLLSLKELSSSVLSKTVSTVDKAEKVERS
ncbi:YcjF family protein [Shewanella sp. 1CM18E]|uniref:TIGR01620 family protein n=1 Tax=Shewanella sp. 1CM18E TaxID=2929169 RepID=UPI0020BE5536|nr:TIGR01620 family protein [Shewanella sp. 1CM18E]MCK8044148.1 YcjF family protein [Shewanella sp. 1CM18E]